MDSLLEELTCPVCLDLYEQPVLLPCAHSLCKRCAGKVFASRKPPAQPIGQGMAPKTQHECPTCRHEFQLPNLGVDGLRKNTTLRNIVDRYRESKNNTAAPKAVPCEMCDKEPPNDAVKTCLVCDTSYCEACLSKYHPMKAGLARHTLVEASSATPKVLMCTEHPQEKVGKHGYHRVGVVTTVPDTSQQNQTKVQPDIYSTLWSLDYNRLWRGEDYDIDPYGDRLFSFIWRHNLELIPTYKAFLRLLDNYNIDRPDYVTAKEENDARAFINRCLDTEVMKEAHSFLAREGHVSGFSDSRKGFADMLFDMWFTPYSRDSSMCPTTAFERTFVGETRCHEIIGLPNWLGLYREEYLGNIQLNDCRRHDCDDRMILTTDFNWKGVYQTRYSSFFVGTSPEFELALYTVCFLAGDRAETQVVLGGQKVTIATDELEGYIRSCYPIMQEQSQSDTEYHTKEVDHTKASSDDNPMFEEGLDFLQYLANENIGPDMGKGTLKRIYEEDYTWLYGRRPRTPFSQVLRTLNTNGKVATYRYDGVDIVTILE
ncbi:uncharacterized protein [Branchiostoma lanceolatum]|uniref:uncharacterized protein isoform X1 n=1 Tax=Branchiostoma lanceolatum TaxID=7740 RepID=UPI003451CCBD